MRTRLVGLFTLFILSTFALVSLLGSLSAAAGQLMPNNPTEEVSGLPGDDVPDTFRRTPLSGNDARPVPPTPIRGSDQADAAPDLTGRQRAVFLLSQTGQHVTQTTRLPETPSGWYENDTQGVRQTWNSLNITGSGVFIGVMDSGVDFGNPALAGRYAVQPQTTAGNQAYSGWPIAFDAYSLETYSRDPGRAWPQNWIHFVNSSYAITGTGCFTFANPLVPADTYTAPGASLSGRYLLGLHPDSVLDAIVLVADETAAGRYDTVYMDLDFDGSFETRMDMHNPSGALDLTGDGVPDSSAGLLYWIADGIHTPPGMDSVYGGGPIPKAGELLAFMIDDPKESGGGHGTNCASTAAGNDGGAFVPISIVPAYYSADYGPLVQGPAPGARIIAMGNVYRGGGVEAWYRFTVLGNDGVPGTGDEPHIVTISYGSGNVDNDVWDWESRVISQLNLEYPDSPLFIVSSGNGGPGYGTTIAPNPATALIVGATTQYGTYQVKGVSETISSPQQVNWGDVARFSGRGPGADGRGTIDLVANGRYGTGAIPLNQASNGSVAYKYWSGTSRSAPAAGGIAALVYRGFFQANGRYPTYGEATVLMLNGATDLGYDPFVQGAGAANAFRAVQSAMGQYGLQVEPARVDAGDYRGRTYVSFPGGVVRGDTETIPFTITNPSPVAVTATMDARRLVRVAHYTATVDVLTRKTTYYSKGVPDYALNLTPWITANPDADLMVVQVGVDFQAFDSLPPTPPDDRNEFWLLAYNWWDDGDGVWWTDLNADHRVDWPAELDGGDEWLRFDYSPLSGARQEVRVGRPYQYSIGAGSAGIWAGVAGYASTDNEAVVLYFDVAFYRNEPWDLVEVAPRQALVPAGEQVHFQADIQVPPDAPYGLYQGMVVVTDSGRIDADPLFTPRTVNVPLTWQVWADASAGATIGGAPPEDGPYDNGQVGAGFDWYDYDEAGDWRFYGFDLQDPPEGSVILAHTRWDHYPTDLDTILFGPAEDEFSSVHPEWFGPSGMEKVGGSVRSGSAPCWNFQTATGSTEEWASAPAADGLHTLIQEAVLLQGSRASEPFTTELGLAYTAPYPFRVDPECGMSCTFTVTFQSSIAIPEGLTGTLALGWTRPFTFAGQLGAVRSVTHGLVFTQAQYRLDLKLLKLTGAGSLELALYDDNGSLDGQWDHDDGLVSELEGAARGEGITVHALPAGLYWLAAAGGAGAEYLIEGVSYTELENDLRFIGFPAAIQSHQPYPVVVRAEQPPRDGDRALLVFGSRWLPDVMEAPVYVEPIFSVFLPLVVND